MGKKRRILIATLLIVLLGGLAWWLLRPGEPSYKGKTLSAWLEDYGPSQGPEEKYGTGYRYSPQTEEALRNIGTNAIPTLLLMVRAKDSPLKSKVMEFLGRHDWIKIKLSPASDKNRAACDAFRVLGAQAKTAVPELVRDYETNKSANSAWIYTYALGCIGPAATDAIPPLLRGLGVTNSARRLDIVVALGQIHGEPERVVPELEKLLGDPRMLMREFTVDALGFFGTNARSAVPDLTAMLNDRDLRIRNAATNALKQIDPEAAAKAGVK
jgi:hypothetical protein